MKLANLAVLTLALTVPALPAQQLRSAPAVAHAARGAAVAAVGAIALTVSDMDRSVAFYTSVLEFRQVADTVVTGDGYGRLEGVPGSRVRVVRLQLGDETLQLMAWLHPTGRPAPTGAHSNDRWFQHVAIIVSDMARAYAVLEAHGVERVSPAPQRLPDWNPNAGGIRAFYFHDPDGHPLEILQFPAGKGDPKWQRTNGRLFLGIDHTAIVVRDTDTSLRFYRDLLGLKIAGKSLNYGPEQERLNNVPGARLRITSLRAAAGPGIEFLEYLSPRDGRPAPLDERANDLVHWQTVTASADLDLLASRLTAAGTRFVSPGVVAVDDRALGFDRGFLVRDPDGHVVQVVAPN